MLQVDKEGSMMNRDQLDFAVFCVENVAERLGIEGSKVYQLLTSGSRLLDNYIIPGYDALHTQGKDYIVNDVIDYMREEGLAK
ncbi:MAG: DUF3791 domain-containing protein [Synergistaceae bacterium]|jgi:hypothetical protein|nr:DUF3791 domain-containing protein [Synergistaceae bacterium]